MFLSLNIYIYIHTQAAAAVRDGADDQDRHLQAGQDLAFTRYCFTSKLYCGSQSSIYCPPPGLTLTVTLTTPTPPVYAMHHTILAMAISCKGQVRTVEFIVTI